MWAAESEICPATGSVVGGEIHGLICQPLTHNVSFINASCADLILFKAKQKQCGAHENAPVDPADPFDFLIP